MDEQRQHCCPENSYPYLVPDANYELQGEYITVKGLKIYATGNRKSKSTVIVAHDIFGPDSGRTKQICDQIANRMNLYVVLPDFFHGKPFFPEMYGQSKYSWSSFCCSLVDLFCCCRSCDLLCTSNKRASWETVGKELDGIVIPFLCDNGSSERIGILGFCWGGWFGVHAAANPKIRCVGAFHPSLEPCLLVGEKSEDICKEVNCPIMMLAAGADKEDVKKGGLLEKSISAKPFAEQCMFEEYAEMKHGWVNRGLLTDKDVHKKAEEAMDQAILFLTRHLILD